jgi:hypothetical protein
MKCVICKHGETKEGTTTVTFDGDKNDPCRKRCSCPGLHKLR